MADIFVALDQLFAGATPDEYPSPWILHRFLASDPDFAQVAAEVQHHVRGPEETFLVWRAMVRPMHLPRAPRCSYVGPKKEPQAEALVGALMTRLSLRRAVAEQYAELLQMLGQAKQAASELGVGE